MMGINNTEQETLHALHRAMARHRKDQQLRRNEMAIQKLRGLAMIGFGLLMLKVGGAEYALPAAPFILLGMWMVATRINYEHNHGKRVRAGARCASYIRKEEMYGED